MNLTTTQGSKSRYFKNGSMNLGRYLNGTIAATLLLDMSFR